MRIEAAFTLVGALFCAGGCASSGGIESHPQNPKLQRDIAEVIKRVRVESDMALFEDLRRLTAYDVFAVEQVSKLAQDPNPRLRSNAMWVLAQIQDRERPAIDAKIEKVLRDGLEDPDRSVRLEAASGLAARNKWDVLPILIDGLTDADSGVRYRCHEALLATTSRNFGFTLDGTPEERAAAVERWRSWYADWKRTNT